VTGGHDAFVRVEMIRTLEEQDLDERALAVGQEPLLDERGYTAVVTVVIVTTLLTPPALKWSMRARDGSRRHQTGSVRPTPVPRVG
jgi:hypothetical protein